MAISKGAKKSGKGHLRVNKQIRATEMRVIGPDNEALGVLSLNDALEAARNFDLDLVEVSPTARPPVCKIIDYGKHKYLEKKKQQVARKKQVVTHLKEVKFRPRTDEHDRAYKMKHLRRFLEDGNKAKITVNFRGREIVYVDKGKEMMAEIAEALQDVGKIEKEPSRQGRTIIMVLAPIGKAHKQETKQDAKDQDK